MVGRLVRAMIPPITLNFFRWVLAFAILLPLATGAAQRQPPVAALAALCGAGPAGHRALQRAAVHGVQTSTPINVTLVGSSMPVWMLAVGRCFGASVTRQQLLGAVLSITGVLIVLSRGGWNQLLALRLVPGDLFMLMATASWSFYSWLLVRTSEPASLRGDWAAFLMAQMVFGLGWSGAFTGVEWSLGHTQIDWGAPLLAALAFIAVGPAVLAYRCWGVGVQRAGACGGGLLRQPRRCSQPCCRRPFLAKHRTCFTVWRSPSSWAGSWCHPGAKRWRDVLGAGAVSSAKRTSDAIRLPKIRISPAKPGHCPAGLRSRSVAWAALADSPGSSGSHTAPACHAARRFPPFGNHIQFQVAGHADDGLHDHIVGLFHAQVVHERLVDLELVERQAREVCQG